jgi:hypothetical protein
MGPLSGVFLGVRQLSRVSVFLGLTRILFTIARVSGSPTRRRGELLRTDFCSGSVSYRKMGKKRRQPKNLARATIAGIKREMQEPRLAKSVRDDPRYQVVLAAEEATRPG